MMLGAEIQVLVATKPVDFRKQSDGLAAIVQQALAADPFCGAAAAELQPLHDHLLAGLKASPKLFCDETRCPVLDPGRGKTKTGFLWALARDDRPWGGTDPPAVAYNYAPGRGGEHAIKLLAGFSGVLQVDGYTVYKQLTLPSRVGGPVTLAYHTERCSRPTAVPSRTAGFMLTAG